MRGAAGDLDDDVDFGIARPGRADASVSGMPAAQRAAVLGEIAHRDPRHPEPHAVAVGAPRRAARSIISSSPPPTVPQPTMPMRISRIGSLADAVEARTRGRHGSPPKAPAPRSRSASRS